MSKRKHRGGKLRHEGDRGVRQKNIVLSSSIQSSLRAACFRTLGSGCWPMSVFDAFFKKKKKKVHCFVYFHILHFNRKNGGIWE